MAQKKLSDDDILTRVNAKAAGAVGWYDSRLSRERQRVLDYYNGKLPLRQHDGSSTYVSTDVYDAVEMNKAQLLEVFAGGDDIAKFDADIDMDDEACRIATKYASYIIFRDNVGLNIFHDVIHDGLTARVGVAMVYWEDLSEYTDEDFKDLSYDDAVALAAREDVDQFEGDAAPETGLFSGTLRKKKDCGRVVIDAVPPEEFLIERDAVSVAVARFIGRRKKKTRAELISMGYDRAKVMNLASNERIGDTPEGISRNAPIDANTFGDTAIQPELEEIEVFESFVRMQIEKKKGVRLYKIVHTVDTILDDPQEVDKAPFLAFVPLPVPHLFHGNNFAARVIPTQNAKTVLVRGVLDHTAITTNPRWAIVSGGLLNPKEMLENRLGGLVNVRRPDSVLPLPQANLNQFVFSVMEKLEGDKEQSTGISSLSQGLNKDAISKQNSQGLVGDLVSLSGQRQKVSARFFAVNFVVPLMQEVLRLAIENQKYPREVEIAGKPFPVDPRPWKERKSMSVSMHLGYGEKDKALAVREHAYTAINNDPVVANMFTPENRFEFVTETLRMAGIRNVLTHPSKVPPQQPDPIKMKELEIKDKTAQAALLTAQAALAKAQQDAGNKQHGQSLAEMKIRLDALNQDREADRKDLETVNRIDVAQREMKLAEEAPEDSVNTVVSPEM